MSNTYTLVAGELEFELCFVTKETPPGYTPGLATQEALRFYNGKHNLTVDHRLFDNPARPSDAELVFNLKYALKNGNATLEINDNGTDLIFNANFGTISGQPVAYRACIYVPNLKEVLSQTKYNELLEKYASLEKSYAELKDRFDCAVSALSMRPIL